mgnify:CR=1 FL=1
MATIEPNEILNYLGIDTESIDSFDTFRDNFEQEYVKKSVIKDPKSNEYKELMPTFVGKVTGSTQTALNRKLKEFGIELDQQEIKDKRIEDIIELGIGKLADSYSSKLTEIESKSGKGGEEINKDLEIKLTSLRKKYGELEDVHNKLKQEFIGAEENWKTNLKNERINHLIAKEHEKIKWKNGIKDIEKEGFFSRLKNNYKIDYDETTNQLDIFDSQGNRIPNTKKSGTWKSYTEILEEEGLKNEVWANNENANKVNNQNKNLSFRVTSQAQQQSQPQQADGRIRKVSSRVK